MNEIQQLTASLSKALSELNQANMRGDRSMIPTLQIRIASIQAQLGVAQAAMAQAAQTQVSDLVQPINPDDVLYTENGGGNNVFLFAGIGVVLLAAVAGVGYWWWSRSKKEGSEE